MANRVDRETNYIPLMTPDAAEDDEDTFSYTNDPCLLVEDSAVIGNSEHPVKASPTWRASVGNLDCFLKSVYGYYVGKGFYPMLLTRIFNLLSLAFVVIFSVFLMACVDYDIIFSQVDDEIVHLGEAVSFSRLGHINPILWICIVVFIVFWFWQLVQMIFNVRNLIEMRFFFTHELAISEDDLQTAPWNLVQERLIELQRVRPFCRVKSELTPHDIANRILRRENFLIALYNKGLLNVTIPMPFVDGSWSCRPRIFLPKLLEWNINKCILDYVFDAKHPKIRERFLQANKASKLAAGLKRRFFLMGCLNLILAPFIVLFLFMYFFFRYADEFKNDPTSLGARRWSPHGRWLIREFNELDHVFNRRLNLSVKPASAYVSHFMVETLSTLSRFVAFIAGSFVAVLTLVSVYDENVLLKLHISENRSVIWYIGVFGVILAVTRSLIPDEHLVFEPERLMTEVVYHTHYFPRPWHGKVHTFFVRDEFTAIFQYKIILFLEEVFSVFITPFILFFSFPKTARNLIDFFREFTVWEEGVGHVCSFALFDFKRHGDPNYSSDGRGQSESPEHQSTANGKMEKSYLNFQTQNPTWAPGSEATAIAGRNLLQRLASVNETSGRDVGGFGDNLIVNSGLFHRFDSRGLVPPLSSFVHSLRPSILVSGAPYNSRDGGVSPLLLSDPLTHPFPITAEVEHPNISIFSDSLHDKATLTSANNDDDGGGAFVALNVEGGGDIAISPETSHMPIQAEQSFTEWGTAVNTHRSTNTNTVTGRSMIGTGSTLLSGSIVSGGSEVEYNSLGLANIMLERLYDFNVMQG